MLLSPNRVPPNVERIVCLHRLTGPWRADIVLLLHWVRAPGMMTPQMDSAPTIAVRRNVMGFGINVDFAVRRGRTHEGRFQEAFERNDYFI